MWDTLNLCFFINKDQITPIVSESESLNICIKRESIYFFANTVFDTGLPTKDETLETTVQNLYCLLTYIHESLQLSTFFFIKSFNIPLNDYIQSRRLNLTFKSLFPVSSFVSNPVCSEITQFLFLFIRFIFIISCTF